MNRCNNRETDVYLTFDIDWSSDEVLQYTIDFVEQYDIAATFFVTHDTPLLARFRENPKIELGIHPNFGPLLDRQSNRTARQIVEDCLRIVPEATSVRTHALIAGSRLSMLYREEGLRVESNVFYHAVNGIIPEPYLDTSGMWRAFHFWEDDVHCLYYAMGLEPDWQTDRFLNCQGVRIFDFHPIHIALNSSDLALYEVSRPHHRDLPTLLSLRKEGVGAESFFRELIGGEQTLRFRTMSEIVPAAQ